MQILRELGKTIDSISWSYTGQQDVLMEHAIACHKAARRVIGAIPASHFPLGKRKVGEWKRRWPGSKGQQPWGLPVRT